MLSRAGVPQGKCGAGLLAGGVGSECQPPVAAVAIASSYTGSLAGPLTKVPKPDHRLLISFHICLLAARNAPRRICLAATLWIVRVLGCDGFEGLRAASIFLARKLRQQVRPVAGDGVAQFVINRADVERLDLSADPFSVAQIERRVALNFFDDDVEVV